MRQSLCILSVAVRGFRNLAHVDIAPSARFNVIAGENGQGKTNLLEAIYVLATSKSFRAQKPGDLVTHGGAAASVKGVISRGDTRATQTLGVAQGSRRAQVDGKRPPSLLAYALRTPVVVFHPGEIALSMGAGAERRRLLDRVVLYLSPLGAAELSSYGRALRARQRTLEARGSTASDLDEWEELIVRHGSAVITARREAAERLKHAAVLAFQEIAAAGAVMDVRYASGAPSDARLFREALATQRAQDQRRGVATTGPHRDDLVISLDGQLARRTASQGQHRLIVLSLKVAEVEVVGSARQTRPLLLLDDVSSELDRHRTTSLFRRLRSHQGQVFLTTTRPELIETGPGLLPEDRLDFMVSSGVVIRAERPG